MLTFIYLLDSTLSMNLWKVYAYKFLKSQMFISGVLVPFFTGWGRISFTQIMLLQTVFVFSVFFFEVPSGAFADRFGRKTSLAASGIVSALAALLYSSYPHYLIFIAAEFIWAAGFALVSGADEALVYDTLKQHKKEKLSKETLGRLHSSELAGYMVAAPIGSVIAATLGLRYTMMLMAIPMLAAFLLALTFEEPKRIRERESYFQTLKNGVRYFRSHRILKLLAFDRISIGALAFFIIWMYQPKLIGLNVPIIFFGFVHAGMAGLEIVIANTFPYLERVLGKKSRYLLLSSVVTGISFIVLGLTESAILAVACILVGSGFGLSRFVVCQNYMNKFIESSRRATVISTVSMMEQFAKGVMYPFMGLLVEWSLSGALIAVGCAILGFSLISRVEEGHLIE
ncbi:MAG: MFS transporter [archaeon]